jgi:hypothetical protein
VKGGGRRKRSLPSRDQLAMLNMSDMKKRGFIRKRTAVLLLASSIPLYGQCQGVFYSPEIHSRVVAPDGAPIAGAIVLISWTVAHYVSDTSLRQAAIAEVVTDTDGQFRIPAWGPRLVADGWISVDEPTTRIYKRGFVPRVVKNYEGVPMSGAKSIIRYLFQDRAIVLQPFEGSLQQYENTFNPLLLSLGHIYDGRGTAFCYWRQTPRMLLALQDLKLEMAAQGAGYSFPSAENYASTHTKEKCGDAHQFFQNYAREKTR